MKRKGYGRKLYAIIEEKLKKMGVKNLYAYIAYSDIEDEYLDNASMKFHENMGFKTIAKFSNADTNSTNGMMLSGWIK